MRTVYFSIDSDIEKKFDIALQLTGEDKDVVLERLIKSYIAQSFSTIADDYTAEGQNKPSTNRNESTNSYYGKALTRIPQWANKPDQINHKILRAFLQLSKESTHVTYDALSRRCSDALYHPDVFVRTFSSNFANMKLDNGNSHGKVFETDKLGNVTLWSYVKETVLLYQDKFLK